MKRCAFLRALLAVCWLSVGSVTTEAAAVTRTFTNPETIIMEFLLRGPATPYPSSIEVAGMTTAVSKVTITLHELSHDFPDDMDIVLVGPDGRHLMIMSDAGSGTPVTDITLTFDDAAPTIIPNTDDLVSGTFRPFNHSSPIETNPPPCPGPPYGANLAVFNGMDPNGTWSLYVADDTSEDGGQILSGWTLNITTTDPIADLVLSLSASHSVAAIGTNITYTITATNAGPADATGVTVSNRLPAGLQFVSATTTQGACSNDNGLVRCNLGSVPRGAGGRVTLVTVPIGDGIMTNVVALVGDQRDHKPTNNIATAVLSVTPVTDLAIRIASQGSVLQGGFLASSIAVTNEGSSAATGVLVSFPLPDGAIFVSAQVSNGSCGNESGTVKCSLGALGGHASAAITVLCRWVGAGLFTNVVTVTGDQFDHDAADNRASTVIRVDPATDLALAVGSSRVDLQACKLEYSIVSPK